MKKLLILINTLLLINILSAQENYHIELAVSYDLRYENAVNASYQWNGTVEERIDELIKEINERAYEKYDVIFEVAVIENFGDIEDLSNDDIAVQTITGLWNSKCYSKDIILHLTGSDMAGIDGVSSGGASGSNLCNSNTTDFIVGGAINYYVQVVEFKDYLLREAQTIAHELGHGLALVHEDRPQGGDPSLCNYSGCTNFMCTYGADCFDCDWTLSSSSQISLASRMENNACVNREDVDLSVECSERYAYWDMDTEIGMDCHEGTKIAKFIIQNDHTPRTFQGIKLHYSPEGNNELILSGEFVESLEFDEESNAYIIPDFALEANEMYEFEIEVNYDNITTDITPNPGNNLAAHLIFNCLSTHEQFDGNTYSLNRQTYIFDRTIIMEDNSSTSDLIAALDEMYNSQDFRKAESYEISINGTFLVDEDLTLDKKHSLHMKENSRIEVVNGSTFQFSENEIIPCSGERWDQIYVESGSNLIFSNVYMEKGTYGINTEENTDINATESTIFIKKCIIDDFTEDAINIKTKANVKISYNELMHIGHDAINLKYIATVDDCKHNIISDAERGIRISNTSWLTNIEYNTFINCSSGISLGKSSALISNCTFEECEVGIYGFKSHGTEIAYNTIGYSENGIKLFNNSGMNIHHNNIGKGEEYGEIGINFLGLDNTRIHENPVIIAERYGVRGMQAHIDLNDHPEVTVPANGQLESGGIRISGGDDCNIFDNYIFAENAAFGIESNNCQGNSIRNNLVSLSTNYHYPSSGILSVGSVDEEITENEAYCYWNATGIEAQNSSGNTYECNYIYDARNALKIGQNAEGHTILTNEFFDAVNNDIEIHSLIGKQDHLGNKFRGGKARAYLSLEDIEDSKFYIDSTYDYHLPEDPKPGLNVWFFPESDLDEQCSGSPGPGLNLYDDPVSLCKYYQHIKSKYANSSPRLYFVKVLHLLRYYKNKYDTQLPDCIKLDPEFLRLCGMQEMVEAIGKVSETMKIKVERRGLEQEIVQLRLLNKNYLEEEDYWMKRDLFLQINLLFGQIKVEMDKEQQEDELTLRAVYEAIDSIDCQEQILIHLKYVWKIYLDLLIADENNRPLSLDPMIDQISRLCADEYGDVVHLARSIASIQGSTEFYSQFDGCNDRSIEPREANKIVKNEMQIVPNPNFGQAKLHFKNSTYGKLLVVNTEGIPVYSVELNGVKIMDLHLENNGVFWVKVTENTGKVLMKKMIIVK